MSDHAHMRCLAISRTRSKTNVSLFWEQLRSHLSIGKEVSGLLTKRKERRHGKEASPSQAQGVRLVASRSDGLTGEVARRVEGQRSGSEYKLHIVMDKESLAKLRWLKAQLEASTDADVIRRALRAYEIFEPEDESSDGPIGPNADILAAGNVEHLYIRITQRMKDRLDLEQQASGLSYGQQVRQALRVLAQLTRDVESWRENLVPIPHEKKKEKKDNDKTISRKVGAIC